MSSRIARVKFIEFGDSTFKREIASGLLELLDQIGCAGEEHAVAVLDECQQGGGAEMALADPRRPEQQDIGTLSDPAVTHCPAGECPHSPRGGRDGVDVRLGQHGDGGEVECVECLAGKQACLNDMALNAASVTFCQFVFHQSTEQTRSAPALFIGLFGKARPETRNCGP
jgi:hypothetical protein